MRRFQTPSSFDRLALPDGEPADQKTIQVTFPFAPSRTRGSAVSEVQKPKRRQRQADGRRLGPGGRTEPQPRGPAHEHERHQGQQDAHPVQSVGRRFVDFLGVAGLGVHHRSG
ncbi:MAG: hypothetical protein ACXWN0_17415 [Isosphaeraceae bacterium]